MHMFRVLAAAAALVITGLSGAAKAAWLDLAEGTYSVTLTCTVSQDNVIPCPSTINGTFTVAGDGLSFMEFTVNGQLFSGDPTDEVAQSAIVDDQRSTLSLTPYAFLSIRNDLSIPFGLADHEWVYCDHEDPNIAGCLLRTGGTWVATLVPSNVPEPAGLGLVALGLALAVRRRAWRAVRPRSAAA